MGYNQENYRRIRREYEGKYLRAREDADRRRAEVRRALPALAGVDAALSATGLELMAANCLPSGSPDWKAIALTAVLAAILFGSKRLLKKKLSPITLICISALLGILVYGI